VQTVQKVPQKGKLPKVILGKVKRWGKSLPCFWRQKLQGKPYGLKDHVNWGYTKVLNGCSLNSEGRSMDLKSDFKTR